VGPFGRTVLVPVVNPASVRPLLVLAARIAAVDDGTVVPLTVVPIGADEQARADAAAGVAQAEATARELGVPASGAVVEAADPVAGTLEALDRHGATLVVMGWRGRSSTSNVFGELIDSLVGRSKVPVAVVRIGALPYRHTVLPVHADHLLPGGDRGLALAAELARRLGDATDEPTTVLRTGSAQTPLPSSIARIGDRVHHDPRRTDQAVAAIAHPSDLVVAAVAPTVSGLRSATTHLAWAAPDATLLVAVDVGPTAEPGLAAATSGAAAPAPERRVGEARPVRIVVTVRLPGPDGSAAGATTDDLDRVLQQAGATEQLMAWWPAGDDRPHVSATVTVAATSINAAIKALIAAVQEAPGLEGAEITYDVDRGGGRGRG
jgi:nucleotide-binding universal stress UspA family protein